MDKLDKKVSAIRKILNEEDFLSVYEITDGEIKDEYDCLLGPLMGLMDRKASREEIKAYLTKELREHFGVTHLDASGRLERFVDKIFMLSRISDGRSIIIDGNKINNLEDFYDQIIPILKAGSCPWGENLDSLLETATSYFNCTDNKELDVKGATWLNSDRSRVVLGKEETIRWLKDKAGYSLNSGGPSDKYDHEIKNLENGIGKTLFERITDIFHLSGFLTYFITTKEDGGQFNKLEQSILDWCAQHYKDPAFVAQIKSASFKRREANSAGFFIDIEVPKSLKPVTFSDVTDINLGTGFPVNGPRIVSKDIETEGGVIIFAQDGYLNLIDIYGYGSFSKENIEDFELSEQVSVKVDSTVAKKTSILKQLWPLWALVGVTLIKIVAHYIRY
jgi:hypothetical protein